MLHSCAAPSFNHRNGRCALDCITHPDTPCTHNTPSHVSCKDRVCMTSGNLSFFLLTSPNSRPIFINEVLQFTLSCLVAVSTIQRMIYKQKLKHFAPNFCY